MVEIKGCLNKLREERPLIHHITNVVTVSECANITLNLGALPVMAYDRDEVAEMVQAAGALVLNIGTLTSEEVDAMIVAGKKANELDIPVIFDPVGVGATELRNQAADRILREIDVSFIKGNEAEINILAGQEGEIKGVESVGNYENMAETAKNFAAKSDSIVIVSGEKDLVTDGSRTFLVSNGHYLMGRVVGTGCMAASVVGSFAGVDGKTIKNALAGMVSFGIVGEIAAENTTVHGPGSYKVALFDAMHGLNEEFIARNENYDEIEV